FRTYTNFRTSEASRGFTASEVLQLQSLRTSEALQLQSLKTFQRLNTFRA
ncbi:hypothetical protein A2U01_0084886, partial [Trifolium medium]|nr:hypothetical protein [Trifolium medium]